MNKSEQQPAFLARWDQVLAFHVRARHRVRDRMIVVCPCCLRVHLVDAFETFVECDGCHAGLEVDPSLAYSWGTG